jgi:hypothetical protein
MAWRWRDLSVGLYVPLLEFNLLARTRPVPRALTAGVKLQGREQNAVNERSAEERDPEEALAELAGFSMLKWEIGNQAFRIHRLVREAVPERLPDEQRAAILQRALFDCE